MALIGKIAVAAANFAIDKPYSYRVPEDMTLSPGQRVSLPFGRGNRRTEGIVLSLEEGNPQGLKCVETCLDDTPLLTNHQLRLAEFLRERYFCTFFDAVRAMLPAAVWMEAKKTLRLSEDRSWKEKTIRKAGAREVLELLEALGGQAEESRLRELIPGEEDREAVLRYLAGKKWITLDKDFRQRLSDRTERIAILAVPPEEAMEFADSRPRSARLQQEVLHLLCGVGAAAAKELCYYTGCTLQTLKRLEGLGYLTLVERPVLRCREIKPAKLNGPLVLTPEQETCYQGLQKQLLSDTPGVALLYGVTGSGKTAVYIRLIQRCLE